MIVFGLAFFVAGIILIGKNYRGRSRVRILRMRPASPEFSSLVVAIVLGAGTLVALATIPLYQHATAVVTLSPGKANSNSNQVESFTPNLSPPGVPQSIGDLFQLTTLLFVLVPLIVIALPLFMRRSSYRGVVEAAMATVLAAFCVVAGFSVGLFFLPTTAAMLIAAAFAREKISSA